MTQNTDILHKDFHYLLELAIDLFDNWENGFKIAKNTLSAKTRIDLQSNYKSIKFIDYSYAGELPIPSVINQRYDRLILFRFEDGIFFTVDKKYFTCYYSENKISGINYFSVDSETREALYMEKKLFGK